MGGMEQTDGSGLLFILMFLPSLALYGFLTWSLVHYFKRREALYALVAMAPLAWWAFAVVAGSYTKAQAEKEHTAVAIVPPPAELPDTIVFEGKAGLPQARRHPQVLPASATPSMCATGPSAASRLASPSSNTICATRAP